jgi:hypothetical protein
MIIKLNEYLSLNFSLCRTLAYGMKPLLSDFLMVLESFEHYRRKRS